MNDHASVTSIVPIETTPQPIRIRAIQRRAPTRSRSRLLGISNRQYAEEEQAGAEAIFSLAEAEVTLQFRRREADVHPIDVGDHVAQECEWNEPPLHAPQDAPLSSGIISHVQRNQI